MKPLDKITEKVFSDTKSRHPEKFKSPKKEDSFKKDFSKLFSRYVELRNNRGNLTKKEHKEFVKLSKKLGDIAFGTMNKQEETALHYGRTIEGFQRDKIDQWVGEYKEYQEQEKLKSQQQFYCPKATIDHSKAIRDSKTQAEDRSNGDLAKPEDDIRI